VWKLPFFPESTKLTMPSCRHPSCIDEPLGLLTASNDISSTEISDGASEAWTRNEQFVPSKVYVVIPLVSERFLNGS
jgi:hypothetical protein